MEKLEKLAKKLGISVDELKKRISENKSAEEDKIKSQAKKNHS